MHIQLIYSVVMIAASMTFLAFMITGYMRWLAFIIIGLWAIQEFDARYFGNMLNTQLFFICDIIVVGYLARNFKDQYHAGNLGRQWKEHIILAIYLMMWVAYLTLEPLPMWWFLYWGTVMQIVLAMPWAALQKIKGFSDHGPLRREGGWNG